LRTASSRESTDARIGTETTRCRPSSSPWVAKKGACSRTPPEGQSKWKGRSRKKIEAEPLLPGCKLRLMVHLQASDRRSANRGQSFDLSTWSCGPEVLLPQVLTGMKKEDNSLARRVKAAAVRGFAKITGAARKRQIAEVVRPTQRDRGDVLDFKGEIEDRFRCVAVLTPMFRS